MELYTLDRVVVPPSDVGYSTIRFNKKEIVEGYESLIWTERYFGNGEVVLACPVNQFFANQLSEGTWLGLDESDDMMQIQTVEIDSGKLKVSGISVLPWLNLARFIRNSKSHKIQAMVIKDKKVGEILWELLKLGINYGDEDPLTSVNTDISNEYLELLKIPELGLRSTDMSGDKITVSVNFGPLYDQMVQIAQTYNIGMQIHLQQDIDTDSVIREALGFRSYKGLNRTSRVIDGEEPHSLVRFSKDLDTLTDIRELHSQANAKTIVFAFATGLDWDLGLEYGDHNSGVAWVIGVEPNDQNSGGLNCRAEQLFVQELDASNQDKSSPTLSSNDIQEVMDLLNKSAQEELKKSAPIDMIDGQIVSTKTYEFGKDYYLGDLVEITGTRGLTSVGRVKEFIRTKTPDGESRYPTIDLTDFGENRVTTKAGLGPIQNNPYDDVGEAQLITGDSGSDDGTNIDCTTDGYDEDNARNSDWLVNALSSADPPSDDIRNWRTTWYKWQVHETDWASGKPKFKLKLTDYNSHMVLFACSPHVDAIPSSGPPSWENRAEIRVLGSDNTGTRKKPPYGDLVVVVHKNFWEDPDVLERWIYIGIAAPPIDELNQTQYRGGKFTLHWKFTS